MISSEIDSGVGREKGQGQMDFSFDNEILKISNIDLHSL